MTTIHIPVTWRSNDGQWRHAWRSTGPRMLRRPLCGTAGWDERYDRPAPARCPTCLDLVESWEGRPIAS